MPLAAPCLRRQSLRIPLKWSPIWTPMVPTIKSVELSRVTQDQLGYSITVEKVEFAEKETRVYVTIQNNGSSNFSAYSFNSKIIQNGKQYEEARNYSADYPRNPDRSGSGGNHGGRYRVSRHRPS